MAENIKQKPKHVRKMNNKFLIKKILIHQEDYNSRKILEYEKNIFF
jgi:hypothetical protein